MSNYYPVHGPPTYSTPNPLLDVDEYKLAMNIPAGDTTYDDAIEQSIDFVSDAIRKMTGRDFGVEQVTETRVYDYSGGVVDIDDAQSVSAVKLDGDPLVEVRDYVARPRNREDGALFWIELFVTPGRGGSPEMGFTRNEDTYSGPRAAVRSMVEVTAEFGWADVPPDVKLAALEMVRTTLTLPEDELQSESLAEYSYRVADNPYVGSRWPARAIDLLRPYAKPNL